MAGGVLQYFVAPGVADVIGFGLVPPVDLPQAVSSTVDNISKIVSLRMTNCSSRKKPKESIFGNFLQGKSKYGVGSVS
jgi:hypothetical protein